MLQMILLLLPGVLSNDWKVIYPEPICAARGSNVTIACTFKHPSGEKVKQVMWCSMRKKRDVCQNGPYVYDSEANNNQKNFQYIGEKTSNCSLLISNINQTDSGEYKFRFITNSEHWTGVPGVKISVHDLTVSMNSSRGNGSTIVGDSLSLTCSLNCPANLAEVQWFKNNEVMPHSNPILTLSSVTAKDSGNYTCSLRNFRTTVSEEFRIYVEDITLSLKDGIGCTTVVIIVVSLVSLCVIIAAVVLIRRKAETHGNPKEEEEENKVPHYSTHQTTAETETPTVSTNIEEAEDVQQEDEVQYASINTQPKRLIQMSPNTEQENESTIYSSVKIG